MVTDVPEAFWVAELVREAGRKIVLAREAVAHAIRLLKPDDRFSLTAYDDEVEMVAEMSAAT